MDKRIGAFAAAWKTDTDILYKTLTACWTVTVFSAFFKAELFPVTLPAIGTIYLFRVLLPVTAILYALFAVREREKIWRDAFPIERWCYILIVVMLICGAASLPRALDFRYTFRQFFNLCFDLCFFFLLLRLCRYRRIRKATILTCAVSVVILLLLGALQTLTAAPYESVTNEFHYFFFLDGVYMCPDVCLGNPNDYAASITLIAASLLLETTAYWRRLERKGHWAAVICFTILYFVDAADQARLVTFSFWILLVAFTLFLLISDRKRLWISLVSLVLISGIWFGMQYRYIMPSIQEYIAQLEEYRQQKSSSEAAPGQTASSKNPPKLQIVTEPSKPLNEQFFTTDRETGERSLRDDGSAGTRAHLLLHAFNCFRESRGLGVGLGNTETLAPRRNVIPDWSDQSQNSIHCFVLRIIADLGIFVLIPLCVIALLLLKSIWDALRRGWKFRDTALIAWALLYFAVLLTFPFLSTASSDSQDMLPMWIYLSFVVLFSVELPAMDIGIQYGAGKYEARCQV